ILSLSPDAISRKTGSRGKKKEAISESCLAKLSKTFSIIAVCSGGFRAPCRGIISKFLTCDVRT
ncbi:MAG TPA: hypothetical protein VFN51_03260, partial [Candidatus Saccharimonadales bacterium]|nr:hypothetical protein [Candidatus Saccharimonadales bacterium]